MTTSIGERPTISAAIIVRDGRLLLVQRRVKEDSLSWQFPAGEVEPGETVEDAVVRERVRKSSHRNRDFKPWRTNPPQYRAAHGLRRLPDDLRRRTCG